MHLYCLTLQHAWCETTGYAVVVLAFAIMAVTVNNKEKRENEKNYDFIPIIIFRVLGVEF
jgi:hypothetical protein